MSDKPEVGPTTGQDSTSDSVWAEGLELLSNDPEAYFAATPPPFVPGSTSMTERRGLTTIGFDSRPCRGTSYLFDLEGREIQVEVTAKRKQVRVFVDGDEWKKADQ